MSSKILIISRGSGFMMDALNSYLIQDGFDTVHAGPNVDEIEEGNKEVDLILLLAGDYIYDVSDILVYIKDISEDEGCPLCVICYEGEINFIRDYIPDTNITQAFKRPFDAKYIADELKAIAKVTEEKKQGKHILLVDDDPTFLKMLHGWLIEKYRVTAVKSGMQAITYIASHKPDLILIDYDMPVATGPQVMEMIRSEFSSKEIPIIFLTGKSDRESIMNVMRLKPQGYFLKSMSRDELVEAIDNYFSAHRWDDLW